MASNNYYGGYTHGGTPYSGGYVTPGVGSSVYSGQGIAPNYSSAPRNASTYDPSFVSNSVTSYPFANRPQTSNNVQYTADNSQYSAGNAGNSSYGYPNSSTYTNSYSSVVTNYAASALYNQHTTMGQSDSSTAIYSSGKPSNWNFKKTMRGNKVKTATKVQQLHYCETYKEHLEGQRHKKKEAQMKSGSSTAPIKRGHTAGVSLRCELCDVTCTGNDAYAAHIRGSKHQKVVKLHTKLGKPIPSTDPVLVNPKGATTKGQNTPGVPQIPAAAGKIKVLGTPRINFIGGGRLHTTSGIGDKDDKVQEDSNTIQNSSQQAITQSTPSTQGQEVAQTAIEGEKESQPVGQDYVEEVRNDDGKTVSFHCKLCDCRFNDPNAKEMHLKGRRHRLQYKKKVDPNLVVDIKPSLKHRKIQEIKDRRYFHKQREHHYWSDWYPPQGTRYGYDTRPIPPPPPPPPPHMHAPPSGFGGHIGGPMIGPYRRGPMSPGSWDDNHIMQKHSEIVPKEDECDDIIHVVQITERALKSVSDKLAEEDTQLQMNETIKKELGDDVSLATKDNSTVEDKTTPPSNVQQSESEKQEDSQSNRILKGLMRVGPLAKNLLLSGDREVDLVVICAEKPTKQLLQRVVDNLPKQLQSASTNDTFEIVMKPLDAGLTVSTANEPKITVKIALTSPLVRESNVPEGAPAGMTNECIDSQMKPAKKMVKEPKQMLERQKCLDALAALRHAKWYQARVSNLYPCPIIIRLIRDLCRRLPTWAKLNLWAVELLCERVISSAGEQLTPGEAFRHVLEALASGLLLPGGAGLFDPCEKDPTDALSYLTRQEREDITSSAQHALRLIAFRQIHKILGVEPIAPKTRKRRNDSEIEENPDIENDVLKKAKKDVSNFAEDEGISSNDGNAQQFANEISENNSQQ
ncbi:zinc finger RNA-binding protein-like protein [Dinothrombium tinctorium]|uniref:Zinc finger RNA-binding protein-like protein n=1 Tax=Dinothrombium tinctorium TaxID=1965070 RepID=A0A3S3PHK5_9ACAR|nr:zinc finger RNA-binding protein-like protein [Dinothrombium tinctorium]